MLLVASVVRYYLVDLSIDIVSGLQKLTDSVVDLAVLLDLNSKKALLEEIGSILDGIAFLWQYFDALVCYSIGEEKAFVLVVWLSKGSKVFLLLKFDGLWSNESLG